MSGFAIFLLILVIGCFFWLVFQLIGMAIDSKIDNAVRERINLDDEEHKDIKEMIDALTDSLGADLFWFSKTAYFPRFLRDGELQDLRRRIDSLAEAVGYEWQDTEAGWKKLSNKKKVF